MKENIEELDMATDETFSEVKRLVVNAPFTEIELKELKTIVDIRLGNIHPSERLDPSEIPSRASLFYSELTKFLRYNHKIEIIPLEVCKKRNMRIYNDVVAVEESIFSYATDNMPNKLTRRQLMGFYRLYCSLISKYVIQCKIPVAAQTILQHKDKFPGLIDRAFPRYAECGILHIAIAGKMPKK